MKIKSSRKVFYHFLLVVKIISDLQKTVKLIQNCVFSFSHSCISVFETFPELDVGKLNTPQTLNKICVFFFSFYCHLFSVKTVKVGKIVEM